jgi:ribosomal-protein-alanine N-acetyltransferase
VLRTARLIVAPVAPEHAGASRAYYERNAAHLAPWEPLWPSDFLTLEYWQSATRRAVGEARQGWAHRFVAFRDTDPEKMVASVNLNNIVRGVFGAAHLGYSVDAQEQGAGIGTEAVGAVVEFGFETLRLHRIMANYQPGNERSARLLRRLGFVPEGFARDYLYIAGAWRDHVLTAKNNPDVTVIPEEGRG